MTQKNRIYESMDEYDTRPIRIFNLCIVNNHSSHINHIFVSILNIPYIFNNVSAVCGDDIIF